MKKIYTLILFTAFSVSAFSQLVVVGTGFNNYAGTSATAPAGWYMSWHSTSSYYTSAGNYGAASPSYKYGLDSVVVITPMFSGADTLTFWCKGNGVPFADTNELHIYHSADSGTWTIFVNRDSLPASGTTLKYGLPASSGWLKFVYRKLGGGNLAFDDVNIISYPNIYASFSDSTVCCGIPTCFTDLSISNNGPIISWAWNFGDGNSSTQQNPCHTYSFCPGTYTVTLIVNNSGGDADTTYGFATVNPSPTAGFTSTINMNVVTFTDMSSGASSWYWDFGDASFSNTQNPVHAYPSMGTYTVCITVTNSFSCSATSCQAITITAVGINEMENYSPINIFPTISENGIFTIHNSQSGIEGAEVYNTVGEKAYRMDDGRWMMANGNTSTINHSRRDSFGATTLTIDISSQPAGIYFVKILLEKGEVTKKIVISR